MIEENSEENRASSSRSNDWLACESCWTHSIPLDDMGGEDDLACPECGCDHLITNMFDGMDLSKWGNGLNSKWAETLQVSLPAKGITEKPALSMSARISGCKFNEGMNDEN